MKTTAIILLLAAFPTVVAAEGLRFAKGRLDEGPVTVLELSTQQQLQVRTKRVVVLTDEQKRVLQKEANVAPSLLSVYSTKAAVAGIDSCFEYNLSVWFEPTRIEVPHRFLVTDEKAAAKADEFDDID